MQGVGSGGFLLTQARFEAMSRAGITLSLFFFFSFFFTYTGGHPTLTAEPLLIVVWREGETRSTITRRHMK